MYQPIIDAHIHFDMYENNEQASILQAMHSDGIEALISVSENLSSAKVNLELSQMNNKIKPAFGFHPEQAIPEEHEIIALQNFIEKHQDKIVAVGEVGLPYYLRRGNPHIAIEAYIELLELFMQQAVALDKPIVLHAIYEDASVVCTLLEKYSVKHAHFHWFKGDMLTIERMIRNGYFISITPDILYEQEIQQLVENYPLDYMMVETDGPWVFEGPFKNELTHPKMIHQTIRKIATIKRMDLAEVYKVLYESTKKFYRI